MLDLFSGIGGFSLAGGWAGFETSAFCENDSFCREVLKKHWPGVLKYMDIRDISNPDHVDLITGGFPCQPFSIAGKKKGKDDARYLWPEFLRIISISKPTWVIAENVTGIVEMELHNIITDLEKENYETQSFIIPACAANAPHRRDRLWIIANRADERRYMRSDTWKEGYLSFNQEWDIAPLQSEWQKLKPIAWSTYKAQDWLEANTRLSRKNDGLRERMDKHRIKALGNSIVPQVAFPIMKIIHQLLTEIKG